MKILDKFRRPLLVLHAALERIPFRPIHVACYQRFEMDVCPREGEGKGTSVRSADARDLESLVRCLDKRRTYERRFAAGEYCLIAIVGASVVGYEWFSAKSHQVEERYGYTITIPGDALYSYDAYTSVEYRGHGIWRQILIGASELMKKEGRNRLIAHVDYGNDGSMRAHEKVGFRSSGWFLFVSAFGVGFLRRLPGEPRALWRQP
jgi:L-amino acid N-acyltransferase YncA